jgi:hypothetical protein
MAEVPNMNPATRAAAVTLADSDQAFLARAFLVTGVGNLKVTTVGGDVVTIPVNVNTVYWIACKRFWSTGSTATGVIAFW